LADLLTSTDDKRGLLLRIFEELGSRLELRVENERLREDLKRKEKSIETMECELIDFHQLARNPLVRLVRGTKRYGTLGILRKSVQRMTAANPTNSNTEGQYH
jgi:hypothetical protein